MQEKRIKSVYITLFFQVLHHPSILHHLHQSFDCSKMTMKKLMNAEPVNWLHVNVLKQLSPTKFIVGDATGLAIMDVPGNHENSRHIEVGKGLRLVKPTKVTDDQITFNDKFTPMKSKPLDIKLDEKRMRKLEKDANLDHSQKQNPMEYKENTIASKILVYVTSMSRPITTMYGNYKIANLIDSSETKLAINLYKTNVNKMNLNNAYILEQTKVMKAKDGGPIRLATTNYTKIIPASNQAKNLFKTMKIVDEFITGTCVMFTNLNIFKTCTNHQTKIDQEGICPGCNKTVDEEKTSLDFLTILHLENQTLITEIKAYKKHLNVHIQDLTTETIEDTLMDMLIGRTCSIDYNLPNEYTTDNMAVRIVIHK